MKVKFFLSIFSVLLLTAVSISAIHFHFFKGERLRLIELNLEQNASLLANADLTFNKKGGNQASDDYINEIIGDDKINMIISIYHEDGTLLYENDNAVIFEAPEVLTRFIEWEDIETKDYFIKYLTVRDADQKRIIRVGMILNQSLLRWKYLSQRLLVFAAIVFGVITIISYFLTNLLFRPVQKLAQHINDMTAKLEAGETSDFEFLMNFSANRFSKDEFSGLLSSISRLSQKINESHNLTKKWSALMAHELKTPLTILRNRMETLASKSGLPAEMFSGVEEEMLRLEKIIVSFLDWATFESDPEKPEIHAVSPEKRGEYLMNSLRAIFPDSQIDFRFSGSDEEKVFCNPVHFDQLISNLVTNAVKYGRGKVTVDCSESMVTVSDEGDGIPKEVLEKLGTPFNHFRRGESRGSGLGLAWVSTICRKYGWVLTVEGERNNLVKILFVSPR